MYLSGCDQHRYDIFHSPFATYTMPAPSLQKAKISVRFSGHHDFQPSDTVAQALWKLHVLHKAVVKHRAPHDHPDCFAQGYIVGEGTEFFFPAQRRVLMSTRPRRDAIRRALGSRVQAVVFTPELLAGEGKKLAEAIDIMGLFPLPRL